MKKLLHFMISLPLTMAAAQPAYSEEIKTFSDCDDCPEMVVIPAGKALIGSSEDVVGRTTGERNRTTAEIKKPFALARTEVTRTQYAQFMTESGHVPEIGSEDGTDITGCQFFNGAYGNVESHSWTNPGFIQRGNDPVLCVSFLDAQAYVAWLGNKTGRTYRIPSNVEFEYAARAGSRTAWSWGNNPNDACEYANVADRTYSTFWPEHDSFNCNDGFYHTSPVGHFKPNAFGLYDMVGNAWEWTADCHRADLSGTRVDGVPVTAAEGEGPCAYFTVMGGGWIAGPGWSRPSARSRDFQHYRTFLVGFRVASDAPGK